MGSTAASPPPPQQDGAQQLLLPVLAATAAWAYLSLTTFFSSLSFIVAPFVSTGLTDQGAEGRGKSTLARRALRTSRPLPSSARAAPWALGCRRRFCWRGVDFESHPVNADSVRA